MRSLILIFTIFFISTIPVSAQNRVLVPDRLKVFVDCQNTGCDMNFIKTEMSVVDFLLDNKAADVHLLITQQETGSGGSHYQLIFFGQNGFAQLQDTLHFNTSNSATTFEVRNSLIRYMKLGLAPFIARTASAESVVLDYKSNKEDRKKDSTTQKKDPWNYWIYNISSGGSLNAEKSVKGYQLNGNLSASRVTEALKLSFSVWGSGNKATYYTEQDSTTQKFVARNNDYGFHHYLVASINNHWSAGYEVLFNSTTYSNYKGQWYMRNAIEYNVFPYKEVSSRYFTFSYGIITRINHYYDTTIYNKTKETLFAHSFEANLTLNKKWGTVYSGFTYSNFLQDWKLNNLGLNTRVFVRITGGLSFNISFYGNLVHDQVYLPRSGASEQEVLTRIRKLKSNFNLLTGFGINYRFGSKLNNFVNPRFEGGNN